MKDTRPAVLLEAFAFVVNLHARQLSRPAENLVLAAIGRAFFSADGDAPSEISLTTLREEYCGALSKGAQAPSFSRTLARLEHFLKEGCPPIPPRGIKFVLHKSRTVPRTVWLGHEVHKLTAIAAGGPSAPVVPRGPVGPLSLAWSPRLLHSEFGASPHGEKRTVALLKQVTVVRIAKGDKPLTIRFQHSGLSRWKFSSKPERQAAFEAERKKFWLAQLAEAERSKRRVWNGRLWCAEEADVGPRTVTLRLRRVRFADSAYVAANWQQALPPELMRNSRRMSATFADHCARNRSHALESGPPVSIVKVGVIVWLPKIHNFVVTQLGTATSRWSLAGKGACYSVMTPEPQAQPKLDDQIRRRLVEDIGLAIDSRDIRHLAFVRDAGEQPVFEVPWVFSVVTVDKSKEEIREIFEARRYPQFATNIDIIPAQRILEACLRPEQEKFERELILATSLFFVSKGAAQLIG